MKIQEFGGFSLDSDGFDSGFRFPVQKYVDPDPQIHHPIDLSWFYDHFVHFCLFGHPDHQNKNVRDLIV